VLELFRQAYYPLDLLVGFASPVAAYVLYRTGRISRFVWHAFWLGVLVGLTWEVPIFVLSGEATPLPIVVWVRPLVAHYLVFMVSHSLWDGLLFVIGIGLVHGLCREPVFRRFRWQECAVLLVWGQVSELLVEVSSTLNDGWAFVAYPWNPALFHVNGHGIRWLMQGIWALAAVAYYVVLIRLRPRYDAEGSASAAP